MAFGGGIDIGLNRHLAIRAVQVDYLRKVQRDRCVDDRTFQQPRQSAKQLPLLGRCCVSILTKRE
jgi:hypothetical protein